METNIEFEDPLEIKFEFNPSSPKHEIEPEVDPLATDTEQFTSDPVKILKSSSDQTEERKAGKRRKKAKVKTPDSGGSSSSSFIDNLPRQNFDGDKKENQNSNKNNDDKKNSSRSQATSSQKCMKDAGLQGLSPSFTCFECLKKFPNKPALKFHIDQSHATIINNEFNKRSSNKEREKGSELESESELDIKSEVLNGDLDEKDVQENSRFVFEKIVVKQEDIKEFCSDRQDITDDSDDDSQETLSRSNSFHSRKRKHMSSRAASGGKLPKQVQVPVFTASTLENVDPDNSNSVSFLADIEPTNGGNGLCNANPTVQPDAMALLQAENKMLKAHIRRLERIIKTKAITAQVDKTILLDIGSGIKVPQSIHEWARLTAGGNPSVFLRKIMFQSGIFTLEEIASSSLTGKAATNHKPKPALETTKFKAIKDHVISTYGLVPQTYEMVLFERKIKNICTDARKKIKSLSRKSTKFC